jgi:hypothetical protein
MTMSQIEQTQDNERPDMKIIITPSLKAVENPRTREKVAK